MNCCSLRAPFQRGALALLVVTATLTLHQPASAALLSGYDLVVFGDLDTNSEVEGKTYVGGNLSGPASNYGVAVTLPKAETSLAVYGNITANNVNISQGSLEIGGNLAGGSNVNLNSAGFYAIGGTKFGNVNNGTLRAPEGMPTPAEALAYYTGASAALAVLPANSTFAIEGGFRAQFTADPSIVGGIAVFNVQASDVFASPLNPSQLAVTMNSAAGMVINVYGANITTPNSMNPVGALATDAVRERLIWNFIDTESITLQTNFNGMLLAPNASLTNNTAIDGQVVVESFVQRGEVHLPISTLFTEITTIPEPAAALSAAAMLVLVMSRRIRG
jgi:choice-of-anchor A domain-containing protein